MAFGRISRVITRSFAGGKAAGAICREVRIPVPWGQIAGKWWGCTDQRPVLTLHGWQDNCGSFDRLVPLLRNDLSFLAIDFPGHGHSSRLPPGMFYHAMNYIMYVRYIQQYFQWSKVSLMGHSLGGITSYSFSMLFPEDVDFTVCIDGSKPMINPLDTTAAAKKIENFFRYEMYNQMQQEPPSYSMEEIIKKIVQPNKNSVNAEHAHYLAKRNIASSKNNPEQYYFTRDPRLKAGELSSPYTQEDLITYAKVFKPALLILKATNASYYENKQNLLDVVEVLKTSSNDFRFQMVEGTHHVHLNTPERIAPFINDFMAKHANLKRAGGGLKNEMMVEKRSCS